MKRELATSLLWQCTDFVTIGKGIKRQQSDQMYEPIYLPFPSFSPLETQGPHGHVEKRKFDTLKFSSCAGFGEELDHKISWTYIEYKRFGNMNLLLSNLIELKKESMSYKLRQIKSNFIEKL